MGDNTKIINKELSDKLYIMRFFAINSAILAHSCYNEIANNVDAYLLARFSRFGVFCFFVLSGFFFKKTTFKDFFSKSAKIVLPWLFLGSFVHLFNMFYLEHRIVFDGFLDYIIGNGSTLYFCTVLVIVKLIFQCLAPINSKPLLVFCWVCVMITVASLLITSFGILPDSYTSELKIYEYINPYLNICNWIGIFALGIILRYYGILEKINDSISIKRGLLIVSIVMLLIGYFEISTSYWSHWGVYIEASLFFSVYVLVSVFYHVLNKKSVVCIGKNTLTIFLLHYPILSLLMKVNLFRSSAFIGMIRPVLCSYIILVAMIFAAKIAKKLKVETLLRYLTGINI